MSNRTAAQILADVETSVRHRREKVRTKKAKRGTLADRMSAFEYEWGRGQREANGGKGMPTRITQRGKKLVKDQILKRADPDFNTKHFAFWVARHWQAIGAAHFYKAKSYPEYPVIPWLITCLETYMVAYEQRDHLDTTASLSATEVLRRGKEADAAIDYSVKIAKSAQEEIERLKSMLRERDDLLDQYERDGKVPVNKELPKKLKKRIKKTRDIAAKAKRFEF